jgi:hypothetical protein
MFNVIILFIIASVITLIARELFKSRAPYIDRDPIGEWNKDKMKIITQEFYNTYDELLSNLATWEGEGGTTKEQQSNGEKKPETPKDSA